MKQLKLTKKELLDIGFEKKQIPKFEPSEDDPFGSPSVIVWEIKSINSVFYYNNHEDVYVWYYKTLINGVSNHIHLNITHKASLFTVLSSFGVDFNLKIN